MVNARLTEFMSLRPPSRYQNNPSGKAPLNVLEYELMTERAEGLRRGGQRAQGAPQRLEAAAPDAREALIDAAAAEVYALFIQREMCGLRNGRDIIARYAIPGAVIARLGVSRKKPDPAS